jgi:hypothetical protein
MDLFSIGLSFLSSNLTKDVSGKKLLSAEGRRILSLLDGKPFEEQDIAYEDNGRPFFKDRHADFNISHSGEIAAVSLVNEKDTRTGCDVQLVQDRTSTLKIADKAFSASEINYISETKINFFRIWTLKECYLKLRGLSVFDMAKVPSFIDNSGCLKLVFDEEGFTVEGKLIPILFYLYELTGKGKQYILAAAIESREGKGKIQPQIKWFSKDVLSMKKI